MQGRIKTYIESKGYGFIKGEDQNDYFFHISEVNTFVNVCAGQLVDFEPSTNEKGYIAKNISINAVNGMQITC